MTTPLTMPSAFCLRNPLLHAIANYCITIKYSVTSCIFVHNRLPARDRFHSLLLCCYDLFIQAFSK